MSYRSFKHLLGETSLERKCRFIFGLGILVLVSSSFFWYGQKTESLVMKQTTQTARMLVPVAIKDHHVKLLGNAAFLPVFQVLSEDLKPVEGLPNYEAYLLNPYQRKGEKTQPLNEFEATALEKFVKAASAEDPAQKQGRKRAESHTFANGTPMWAETLTPNKKEFQYIQAVRFKSNCLMDCHGNEGDHIDNHHYKLAADGEHWVETKVGDLAGAVVVNLPMEQTYKAINSNRAILITAAMVTAILAMVSSYMIVRYVIVKPVKHLRDVSDAIAAGRLTIRSQIQTGDEFEDLARIQPDAS